MTSARGQAYGPRSLGRPWFPAAAIAALAFLAPNLAWAHETDAAGGFSPGLLAVVIVVPLLFVLASAFVKVAVVLGLVRNAFGSQDVPPALVVTAIAAMISVVVMAPVIDETVSLVSNESTPTSIAEAKAIWTKGSQPLVGFLERNADPETRAELADALSRARSQEVSSDGVDVLLPAFVATELTEAFQMGLLLLLPFLVLDLIVGAVLAAGGLGAVQPAVVALPLKLVLFVTVDGWRVLLESLLLGYL